MTPNLQGDFGPELLLSVSRPLILLSFGGAILMALSQRVSLQGPILRLIGAALLLGFYLPGIGTAERLSKELTAWIDTRSRGSSLTGVIADHQISLAKKGATSYANLNDSHKESLKFLLRTSVWGVTQQIAELFFLLTESFLEDAQRILWRIWMIFFPLGIALLPLSTSLLVSSFRFGLELQVWIPLLKMISGIAAAEARTLLLKEDTWGINILTVEVIGIILILAIPLLARQLISGAASFAGIAPGGYSDLYTGVSRATSPAQSSISQLLHLRNRFSKGSSNHGSHHSSIDPLTLSWIPQKDRM